MAFDENLLSYLEAFLEETDEQLQALEEKLVHLEKDPRDRGCLEEVFRIAHTLKGNAATVGFEGMAGLAHRMEDLLACLRRGTADVTPEVTDVLLACLDALKGLAEEAAGRGGCTADLATLTWRLESLVRKAVGGEEKLGDTAAQRVLVKVELADDCAMRAARAFVVLRCLEELGTLVEARPAISEVERLGFEGNEIEATVAVPGTPDLLVDALSAAPEVKRVQVLPLETPAEVRIEVGDALDLQALAARLAGENAVRVVLDLTNLRELSPGGLDWLLSLKGARAVEFVLPCLPAGRKLFELLATGGSLG